MSATPFESKPRPAWLEKRPENWTADDADVAKREFVARRPAVPGQLACKLWQFWKQRKPSEPFFDDEEQNVALLLHARAHDEEVPPPGNTSAPARLLEKHKGLFETPLVPSPLAWGAKAVLATEVQSALDSPVLHAWIFVTREEEKDAEEITRVLVVGRGIPEIHDSLFDKAFLTSLRLQANRVESDDILNIGTLCLNSLGAGPIVADLPYQITSHGKEALTAETATTAQAELRIFVGNLKDLERESGLIRVHEVVRRKSGDLYDVFTVFANETASGEVRVWSPGPNARELTDAVPYLRIPGGGQLAVSFNPDLLRSKGYQAVLQAFHLDRVRRLLIDLFIRWDVFGDHEVGLLRNLKAWDDDWSEAKRLGQDPEEYCVAQRGPKVWLTEWFDDKAARFRRLPDPEQEDTATYYKKIVPGLINQNSDRRRRAEIQARAYLRAFGLPEPSGPKYMEAQLERLERLTTKERLGQTEPHLEQMRQWFKAVLTSAEAERANLKMQTPFARAMASRFLDAVMRDRVPHDIGSAEQVFKNWCECVQPMFRFEWRCQLRDEWSTNPAELFNRQTFFHSRIDVKADETTIGEIFVRPFVIVDQRRSAVIFDHKNKVSKVRDATESVGIAAHGPPAEALWQGLFDSQPEPPNTDIVTGALRQALQTAPGEISRRILAFLTTEGGDRASDETEISNHLNAASEATAFAWLKDSMDTAFAVKALQSVRRCLDGLEKQPEITVNNTSQACFYLVQSVIECLSIGMNSDEIKDKLPKMFGNRAEIPDELERPIQKAVGKDRDYVTTRLGMLEKFGTLALQRQLLSDLPRPSVNLNYEQSAVFWSQQAVESVQLAKELKSVAAKLSERGESGEKALLLLGLALEKLLLPDFAKKPDDDLFDLCGVLVGQDPPRFGGRGR